MIHPAATVSGNPAERDFERLVGALDPEMVVVTVGSEPPAGCLVGFHCQTGITPPRYLVCLSKKNQTYRAARDADTVAVHFLPTGARDIAKLFGTETGDEAEKFARCEWRPGPDGVPILGGCLAWFSARIVDRFDVGDHGGFLLSPLEAEPNTSTARVLRLNEVEDLEPGHEA
jgi:flavin reductase (DIM6/NTAB) family NADH-FMN oxidoreductase RutF